MNDVNGNKAGRPSFPEPDPIERLLRDLSRGVRPPERIQKCPKCGGRIRISYAVVSFGGSEAFGMNAFCHDCHAGLALEFSGPAPPWARDD